MERKLVKQGASTIMVSLPAKWIRKFDLKKGDSINLREKDNRILIFPKEKEEKLETKIKLRGLTESSIRTLITNTYRRGYDKIDVKFENKKQFQLLKTVVKTRLIGFEVVEKKKKSCVVENITEPSTDKFKPLLNKVFMNISSLFEITKEKMAGEEAKENYEEVEERIQKYDNFCRRVIFKKKHKGEDSEMFWTFLTLLIHGQREIYHLNKLIRKKKVSKKTIDLLDKSKKIFELIHKSFKNEDISPLSKVHKIEKEAIYKEGFDLLKTKKENPIIYHILLSIREFYQSNSPLTGLIL